MNKNYTGIKKEKFILYLLFYVFCHYTFELIRGKLKFANYWRLQKRLLYLIRKLKHNKFVKIQKKVLIDLYIPAFPSKAFFKSCDKFKVFSQDKFPCTTTLISITNACRNKCFHCYQRYDKGPDLPIEILINTVKKLQDLGISFFNIEGGDPFIKFDRLYSLCMAIDNRSVIWINSTGDGIDEKKLKTLKESQLKVIMFPLPVVNVKEYNKFYGQDLAYTNLQKGIELCHKFNIGVAINTCPRKDSLYNGEFIKIIEKAKSFGASIVQIIKPKAAGASLNSDIVDFNDADLQLLKNIVNKYNNNKKYANWPALYAQIIAEADDFFGCTAGGTDRFYINAKGDVQPCEFLNISFGNIYSQPFEIIYEKMRQAFFTPCTSWLCEKFTDKINIFFQKQQEKKLPLSLEESAIIMQNWDRGKPTELYKKIQSI